MTLRVVRPLFAVFVLAGFASAADSQLMNLMMPNAKVVAGVNVEQAKNSPFGQFMLSRFKNASPDWTAATGFDPRRDISEVLMGTAGQPGQQGLVLVRGNFNTDQIIAAAKAAGHSAQVYNGVTILTGQDDTLTHGLAFLNNSIAIAGDMDNVKAAIDRKSSNGSQLDPALAAAIQQLSGAQDAWTISTVPFSALAGGKLPDARLNGMLNTDVLKELSSRPAAG